MNHNDVVAEILVVAKDSKKTPWHCRCFASSVSLEKKIHFSYW